ncbi:MAG: N-6 DNA methylase [Myxococcota bacterium]|nr:N-6 DNA methylase [Myxococcota bacterium]
MSLLLKSVTIIEQALSEGLCHQLASGQLTSKLSADGHSKKSRAEAIEQAWINTLKGWSNSKEDPKEALRNALELNSQIHSELVSLPPAEDARLWSLHIDMERVTLVRRSPELSQPAISFDLQAMCDNEERSAFRLLWILTHPSRWHQQLEAWHKESLKAQHLRRTALLASIRESMLLLGNSLLSHPDNTDLRTAIIQKNIRDQAFHHQLTRVFLAWMLLKLDGHPLVHSWAVLQGSWSLAADDPSEPVLFKTLRTGFLLQTQCGELSWFMVRDAFGRMRLKSGEQDIDWSTFGLADVTAVYEYLLDVDTELQLDGQQLNFAFKPSKSRSESGAYYTPAPLVHHLLSQTLDLQLDEIAKKHPNPSAQIDSILELRVCDPTCGAGNFLIGAAERILVTLNRLCAPNELPQLKRQVIDQCLYGVDLNPMTVELCELSLWRFAGGSCPRLSKHIQHGNALIGTEPEWVASGLPDAVWNPCAGDHSKTVSDFRKAHDELTVVPISPNANLSLMANLWTAAFLMTKSRQTANSIPTQSHWNMVSNGQDAELTPEVASAIHQVVEQHRPFHWRIRFPEVFEAGGFDLMVGNPPFINQLVRGKALPRHVVAYLAHTLNMTVGYADVASLIMLWVSRFLKSNGIVSMVQPLSIVMTDSSQPVRMQLLKSLQLRHIWATGDHIFDDAMVFACTLTLQAGSQRREIGRHFGNDFERCDSYTGSTTRLSSGAAKWGWLLADLFGIPNIDSIEFNPELGLSDLANATAGFRDQYYFPKECARERAEVFDSDHLKIITSGAIHPLRSQFGLKPSRYNKRPFEAPVFPEALLQSEVPDIWRWFKGIGGAKLLMAQQSSVLRVMVDMKAECYPMVPVVAIVPHSESDCWKIAALLVSPVATAWVLTHFLGGGMNPNSIKVSAEQLLGLPLPKDDTAWNEAAKSAEAASQADSVDEWRSLLIECGRQMNLAFGIRDEGLHHWWVNRLPTATL